MEQIGKYELLSRLGQGGMGDVWKARDTQLRRYVAIKLLNADLQANPNFVDHFLREAQLVASLRHPNIVQIHDFQLMNTHSANAQAYMVMDYIEGGTLAGYIRSSVREGIVPPASDIVALFTAIGLALDYAHQKGMIHRDIKPANILLDRPSDASTVLGTPILSDFGIARLQGVGTSTVTRNMIGTPLYISPEQAQEHELTPRSDLYSLGIVLYEIVTGRTPFRGDNPFSIMMQHLYEQPTPPTSINPAIAPALSNVILQSIAKDPAARFASGVEMATAIAHALNMAVPVSLGSQAGSGERQAEYNPLQPVRGMTGQRKEDGSPARLDVPLMPLPVQGKEVGKRGRAKAGPYIIGVILLLLVVGIGMLGVLPRIFSQSGTRDGTVTPTGHQGIVGQIRFIHSAKAAGNVFDQLEITLAHIAPPPVNTAYYGWLVNTSSPESSFPPHWLLSFANGSIHSPPGNYSSPNNSDLYSHSDQFLVTEESLTNPPVVPGTPIYYAIITHTSSSSPTFDVRQCPANGGVSPCQ